MTSQNPNAPKGNLSLSNNPFVWGNIALIASLPWLLVLSMSGLAVGDPVFPEWFEIFLLGFPAIALVAWVQWQQPISPFSLWIVSKPSESLSDRERQILTLVKQHSNGWYVTGWIATAVAIAMSAIFCKIYISAPLAQAIAPFPAGLRLFGILWAEIFFFLSNILLQAGVSALRIKLTAESELNGLKPFAPEKIKNSFTSIGWQSPQILKFFEETAAIAQVSDDVIKVESAEQSPEVSESQEAPDAEAIEPSNFIAEAEPEAFPEIITLVEDMVSEPEAIADTPENLITDPIEFVEDSEAEESLDSLKSIEIISEPKIETIPQEEIIQEPEELEPIEFLAAPEIDALDITDTSLEPELEPETNTEVTDISLGNDFVEEVEELEVSEIVAEESINETISETDSEQFIEEIQTEPSIDIEASQTEELEPIEIVEETNVDFFGNIIDLTSEREIDESATSYNATVLELADVILDEQFVDEHEELQISKIVSEESVIEATSEPEIEQFFEESKIEVILNQEIFQENEELNPFELVEDEQSDIEENLGSTEDVSNLDLDEEIAKEADEPEAFETPKDPELTFLEIPDDSLESQIEENELAEGNLELSADVVEDQLTEDSEELESPETTEDSDIDESLNTAIKSNDKRNFDFLKKSRKTGGAQKRQGFGKSIKRDHNVFSSSDPIDTESLKATEPDVMQVEIADPIIEIESDLAFTDPTSEPEINQELDEEPKLEAIATPIEQDLEETEIRTQDFDDELDELIAFNAYVENILKEYLEDNDEEALNEEALNEEAPEVIDPSIVFDPAIEALAISKESVEAFNENLPDLETQDPANITEEISINENSPQDPEYLVQELLVDKFLARIEELNIAGKSNKAAIEQTPENISKPNPEIDEFADLEALLDGKPENHDTDDLSDRNS
ncbi:low-complexity tail membrane protein [Pseudanabaena sp. BC1403]|uniref:low-complexity tail membrane protein n=1 Tax=Pseudanabaena sp. BC1403 TaxID=2043171 RepID=UPI000CD8EABA|nr:low-complexity tail membrane protein [Pseudanabaena sp. BC1403]